MPYKRIAIVTGANRGLGKCLATELAKDKYHVFLGTRNRQGGLDLGQDLQEQGLEVTWIPLDVSDVSSVRNAYETVSQECDHIDILINNAGINIDECSTILNVEQETIFQTIQTNTLGPLLLSQLFAPLLSKSNGGRIINVSSAAGQLSGMESRFPAYSISKTALNAVTRQLASALSTQGIAVNSVCPGWCRTNMGGATAPKSVEEGVDTILWLAREAPQSWSGRFFRDREEIVW